MPLPLLVLLDIVGRSRVTVDGTGCRSPSSFDDTDRRSPSARVSLPLHCLPRCLLGEGHIRQHSVHTARGQVYAVRLEGRFVDVPVSERQIRLENDVHVVAHVFDGTVDHGQVTRVRPFTERQHTTYSR